MGGTTTGGGGGGGGLDAYNQFPKVLPTPTDDLTVDDLSRPRTIGYIKQPFLPATPNVVMYRPVILLPKGTMGSALSTPSSKLAALALPATATMTNGNSSNTHSLSGISGCLYQQSLSLLQQHRHQQQLRLPPMTMTATATAATSSSLLSYLARGNATHATTNPWLKSDYMCRRS